MLSIIFITKNEEKWLEGAIKSALFADEIIVVDSQSEDSTLKIAKKYTKKIYVTDSKSFSDWRNLGLKKAKGNWLFYLDADERITPELKKELLAITKGKAEFSSYVVPRFNFYFGFRFRFSGSYPDYQHRLFAKKTLIGWQGLLHERPIIKDGREPGKLKNPIWHFTHRDISSMLEKTNKWSLIEAKELLKTNHPPMTGWRFFSVILRSFGKQFFSLSCWRDGTKGIVEGLFQVFSSFITYAKLWELQKKETSLKRYMILEKKLTKNYKPITQIN